MKEFKSDNEFDELFQETLKGDSITPSDNVWGNIESRLDKESNKPKFIFWLSLFIGIVLIGTISFLALEKSNSANQIADKTIVADKTATPIAEQNSSTLQSDSPTKSENTPDTKPETTSTNTDKSSFAKSSDDKKKNLTSSKNATIPEPENNNTKKSAIENEQPKIVKQKENNTTNNTPFPKGSKGITKKEKPIKSENTSSIDESKKESTTSKSLVKKASTETNKTAEPLVTKHVSPKTSVVAETSVEKKSSEENPALSKTTDGTEKESPIVSTSNTKTSNTKVVDEKPSTVKTSDNKENKTASAENKKDINKISVTDSSSIKKIALIAATPIVKKDNLLAKDSVKSKKDTLTKKDIAALPTLKIAKDSIIPKVILPFPAATLYAFYGPDYFYSKPSSTQKGFDPSTEKQALRFSLGLKIEYRPMRMIGIQVGCAYSEIKQEQKETELRFSKYINSPYSIYSSLGEMKVDPAIM